MTFSRTALLIQNKLARPLPEYTFRQETKHRAYIKSGVSLCIYSLIYCTACAVVSVAVVPAGASVETYWALT